MTKAKAGSAAAKQAGILLRAAITKQLRDGGPQTAAQVHAVLGGDFEIVRDGLYRLSKSGVCKSQRGVDRMPSTYCLSTQVMIARNVDKPHRPVVKKWEPIIRRDPLVCFLFGAPA